MSTKVYDLNRVSALFLGVPIMSGFGESAAIKIERLKPDFEEKEGCDGEVTRYSTGSRLCRVTFTLMQSSVGNATLSTLNQLDRSTPNGAGVGPLLIKNDNGIFVFIGKNAYIKGPPPTVELNAEPTEREWILSAVENVRFDGA